MSSFFYQRWIVEQGDDYVIEEYSRPYPYPRYEGFVKQGMHVAMFRFDDIKHKEEIVKAARKNLADKLMVE